MVVSPLLYRRCRAFRNQDSACPEGAGRKATGADKRLAFIILGVSLAFQIAFRGVL